MYLNNTPNHYAIIVYLLFIYALIFTYDFLLLTAAQIALHAKRQLICFRTFFYYFLFIQFFIKPHSIDMRLKMKMEIMKCEFFTY